MVPRLRGNIRFKAARVPYTTPRYVTSVTRLYSSGCISFTGENTEAIALLTQTSIGPNSRSTAWAEFSTAPASETSTGRTIAWPPSDSISRFAASSPSIPRAISPTLAPCLPNWRAAARPKPADAPVITTTSFFTASPSLSSIDKCLNKFAYLIGDFGQRNLFPVRLAASQGFRKVQRLLHLDLGRHGRFERIDCRLQDGRPGSAEKFSQDPSAICRIFHAETDATTGMGERGEIDGMQVDRIFGIAQENHLLPLDLSERVVLDNHNFDGKFVLDRGYEVGHQHGKAAISDKSDALAIRKRDLRRDRIRQTRSHRRQISRQRVHLPAAHQNVTRPPGCNGSAVATHDCVILQSLAQLPRYNLWFHRLVGAGCALLHQFPPILHSGICLLREFTILFAGKERNQFAQRIPAIADQSDFDRVTQSNSFRIKLDLHPFRLARFRHELDVREGTAHDQHCVAIFQCFLRGLGSKQANTARCVWTVIRNRGFSEQRFYDRCAK